MRCCLMVYLLKCLVIFLQNPQPLSHFHICPKPKVKLGPTNLIYPAPLSSLDIATTRNPNQFGLTDRDLSLTEMGLQTLYFPLQRFGLTDMSDRSWGSPGLGGVQMAGLYLQPDSWTMKIQDWRLRPVSGRDFPWRGRQAWRYGYADRKSVV